MAKLKKFRFNMVEIAIAIAIIAFGVAALIGLFPTVIKQGKKSAENNQLSDVVYLVKGLVDYKYSSSSWSDFKNEFRDSVSSTKSDIDVNMQDIPLDILTKIKSKPVRLNYTRGVYKGNAEDKGKNLIASYDVDIWKEPISGFNIGGKIYTQDAKVYDYGPGATIVIKVSAPAGVAPELQDVVCFKYDYVAF